MYPPDIRWPRTVHRIEHLDPGEHRRFYNSQRYTLNITRADMVQAGYSPSVRLFEAAACATPIITDFWEGLDTLFEIGSEILVAKSPEDAALSAGVFRGREEGDRGKCAAAHPSPPHVRASCRRTRRLRPRNPVFSKMRVHLPAETTAVKRTAATRSRMHKAMPTIVMIPQ